MRSYWQLSFADETGFLGGFVTEAPDMRTAIERAWLYECNPGGEVCGLGFVAESVDMTYLNRALTADEQLNMPTPIGLVPLTWAPPT